MELKLNIPENTYQKPIEVRPEVVQLICDALMKCRDIMHCYHPKDEGYYRKAHDYVSNNGCFVDRDDKHKYDNKDLYTIRTIEMQYAFNAIIKAGWHIFKYYAYGSWVGFFVKSTDYDDNAVEVKSFEIRLD